MSRRMTSDELISTVRRKGMVPSDTSTYTDEAILEVLNEEIDVGLLQSIMSVNEEHLVNFEEQTLVPNKNSYRIPYRAVGNKLRDVALIDSSGNVCECTRISLEDLSDFSGNMYNSNLYSFYVQNDSIVFPSSEFTGFNKVRMYFYLRPNKLVLEEDSCKITAINTLTGVISVNNLPDDFSSLPSIDFIVDRSPNKILSYDIPITSVSLNSNPKTITIDPNDIPDDLVVGDWICKAEESCIPNIPTEWHPVLAQRAVVYIMESLGDTEGLNNSRAKLAQVESSVMKMTDNRIEGAPQKIRPRHTLLSGKKQLRIRGF